ncbi:acetyltransferase [Robiginitalea sp. IMCC43444]|uniref:acetyltransferase n=1 Tax=Robiginitalea sp. IMCC43444 TaxID=3459121 RepID=UPI004041A14B
MNSIMDKQPIRLYGAGGHSQVILDLLADQPFQVTAIFDDHPEGKHPKAPEVHPGISVDIKSFPFKGDPCIIAIGDNAARARLSKELAPNFITLIHKTAVVSHSARLGTGTVVYAGAIIQPNTQIGEHVIINTAASVDHDNVIGDFVHISPKATLTGHVTVGEGTHIGAGAVVIPKIKIGKWCIVGAGAVVIKDVPDYAVVVGNPAKIIKYNK